MRFPASPIFISAKRSAMERWSSTINCTPVPVQPPTPSTSCASKDCRLTPDTGLSADYADYTDRRETDKITGHRWDPDKLLKKYRAVRFLSVLIRVNLWLFSFSSLSSVS